MRPSAGLGRCWACCAGTRAGREAEGAGRGRGGGRRTQERLTETWLRAIPTERGRKGFVRDEDAEVGVGGGTLGRAESGVTSPPGGENRQNVKEKISLRRSGGTSKSINVPLFYPNCKTLKHILWKE